MPAEDTLLATILVGELPKIPHCIELEEEAIGFLFGAARFVDENKAEPIKQKERALKRRLRVDPSDESAQIEMWRVNSQRKFTILNRESGWSTYSLKADRTRKVNETESYVLARLAKICEWRTAKRPSLTLVDGEPTDDFFEWAAAKIEEHFRRLRVSNRKQWVYSRYRKIISG